MTDGNTPSESADTFERYSDEMVQAAGAMYGAIRRGEIPDSTRSRINLTPIKPGDSFDANEYMMREAKLNSGVRCIVRYCVLLDDAEEGGFVKSRLAKVEMFMTRFMERAYIKSALGEGGVIERVRDPYHPDTTVSRSKVA